MKHWKLLESYFRWHRYSTHWERPRRCHVIQRNQNLFLICVDLTLLAGSNILYTVMFHSRPFFMEKSLSFGLSVVRDLILSDGPGWILSWLFFSVICLLQVRLPSFSRLSTFVSIYHVHTWEFKCMWLGSFPPSAIGASTFLDSSFASPSRRRCYWFSLKVGDTIHGDWTEGESF